MNSTNTTNETAATQTAGESHSQINNRQSLIVNRKSAPTASTPGAPTPSAPPPKPKFIDTWDIPFPKNMAELAALDATREFPYLKSLCNRRHIHTPGKNPTPAEIIPIIERILTAHIAKLPQGLYPTSDILNEWTVIRDDLADFLNDLRNLLPTAKPVANQHTLSASSALNKPVPSPQSSGHSNNSHQAPQKTPAIPTNQNQRPKTLRHSNNSPLKTHSAAHDSPSQIQNRQSSIINRKSDEPASASSPTQNAQCSMIDAQSSQLKPQPRPRRIHPILARLTPDQKQQLIHIYEQHSAKDAARIASEKFNLPITTGTLSRLYSSWQIAEDNDTRQDLEAAHNTNLENLTQQQLQLRLLQLASRPNIDHAELRNICQSFARLESLKLSQRRVQLAEAKEARLIQKEKPRGPFSPEKCREGLRVMLGKADDEPLSNNNPDSITNQSEVERLALRGVGQREPAESIAHESRLHPHPAPLSTISPSLEKNTPNPLMDHENY